MAEVRGEQEVRYKAWQEAVPTAATISSNPMNLRRKSGMAASSQSGR